MTEGTERDKKEHARLQGFLSHVLLYGVLLSTVIIMMGLILMGATGSTGYGCDSAGDSLSCILSYSANHIPHGDYPNSLSSLVSGLQAGKPFAVIQLGVIVLLATPVLRVFSSLVIFAVEKDKSFFCITLFVFLVLMFSFFVVPQIAIFKA